MRDEIPRSVLAADGGGPTPPLEDFLLAYETDDNWWWRLDGGHHQNLFETAVDRMVSAEYHVNHCRLRHPEDFE